MNSKGQAFIEAVFILPILLIGFALIFQILLYLSTSLAVDNTLDNFLLCKIENSKICETTLLSKLSYLPIRINKFEDKIKNNSVLLQYTAFNLFHVTKERSLQFSKNIYVQNK